MTEAVCVDLVIKLGGSAITDKLKLETLKATALSDAVKLIKQCVYEGLNVVVVHGAGSFGHQQAREYSVHSGWMGASDVSSVKKGFSLTRISCLKLHSQVVEQLSMEGLSAVGLSPCGKWITRDREVVQSGVATVCDFLRQGFVPVLHGDCVTDTARGCTILSGDTVIKTLCKDVRVKRVVFLTDVAGVYDRPPHIPGAKLIPNIVVDKTGKVSREVTTDMLSCDVTGGIKLKLQSAIDIVLQSKGNTPVFVCQVGSEAAQSVCCSGQIASSEGGTVITLSEDK